MAGSSDERIGGMTTGDLELASWWVRYGLTIRRVGYGSLIALIVIFWGYAVWGLLDAYVISYPRESLIPRQIAINQQLLGSLSTAGPQDVGVSAVSVFPDTDGRYDMLTTLQNPNGTWWADFNYRFSLSGVETPLRTGYVLPNSTQVVTELGYKPATPGGTSATLEVSNIHWHRVDPSVVGASWQNFATSHFAVTATNATYDTSLVIGTKRVGQTTFTLSNPGAYGFWSVPLVIELVHNQTVLAVQLLTINNVQPGQSQQVQDVFTDPPNGVTGVVVIPQVNILDPSVYLPTQYFTPPPPAATSTSSTVSSG